MKWRRPTFALALLVVVPLAPAFQAQPSPSSEKRRNNLVAELLQVFSISGSNRSFGFNRSSDGWTFFSTTGEGDGTLRVVLDSAETVIVHDAPDASHREAMRYLAKGRHTIRVESSGSINLQNLEVKAIPELMHCGLGFNPEIKSYGVYDWDFLRRDILPNVTTLIVPNNIQVAERPLEEWHRQGKKFVAEVGISSQAKTAEEHAKFWNSVYDKTPFLDGLIINEFIVNRPVAEWAELNPERLGRIENERKQYKTYGEAIKKMRADNRYKMFYAYVGGSGKELNQEIIGTNFVRTIKDCGYRVALERYLHEMSNLQGSRMKMFSCDYQDLVNAKARKMEEAMRFIGSVTLEGVEVAPKKSFAEMYSSNPEPKIPVWITYHWKVFRAKSVTATLIVSDWPSTNDAGNTFGQEQTFNFLEIQPYHE